MAEHVAPVVLRGTIGCISEFKPEEDWVTWQERLEQYLAANYIESDKKVAVLLTLIGEQAYKTLRDLCDPILPKDRNYEELCDMLKNQFSKRISIFKERIEFYELRQTENETVRQWFVRIKSKASACKFGNKLSDVLRDKFVAGLKKGSVLDRVCEEEHTKTAEQLLETALNKEATMGSLSTHLSGSINQLVPRKRFTYRGRQDERKKKTDTEGTVKKDQGKCIDRGNKWQNEGLQVKELGEKEPNIESIVSDQLEPDIDKPNEIMNCEGAINGNSTGLDRNKDIEMLNKERTISPKVDSDKNKIVSSPNVKCRPRRQVKPPDRLNLYISSDLGTEDCDISC